MICAVLLGALPVVLTVTPPEPVELRAGQETVVRLEIDVKTGFHVQANPASADYLVPLVATIPDTKGVKVGAPKYPPPVRYRLKGTSDDLLTLEGHFAIELPLQTAEDAEPGELRLEGSLRYQACNERTCLRPTSVPIEVTVVIKSPPPPD